jgi:hypothetical protein
VEASSPLGYPDRGRRVDGKTGSHSGQEVGFWEIAIDVPQARFWTVSGFADNPPIWTVPSGGSTLDLIGARGSNRDFCSALSCVFSSTPRLPSGVP